MYSELPTLRIAPHMAILGWGFVRVIFPTNPSMFFEMANNAFDDELVENAAAMLN